MAAKKKDQKEHFQEETPNLVISGGSRNPTVIDNHRVSAIIFTVRLLLSLGNEGNLHEMKLLPNIHFDSHI